MGFFDIFRKKTADNSMNKKLAALSCKKVNYVAVDFTELCENMAASPEYLMKLKPVNYYALKDEYIEAAFYSDGGHDENYVVFRFVRLDKAVSVSDTYPVPKDILRKAYEKLGAVNF